MAQKLSTKLRTDLLDNCSLKDAFTSMELRVYTGAVPATADAGAGTHASGVIAATCAAVAFDTAALGVMSKSGTWADTSGTNNGGTITYYRLVSHADDDTADNSGTTWPRIQGTVGMTGGGQYDMVVGTNVIAPNANFQVDFYTQTIITA